MNRDNEGEIISRGLGLERAMLFAMLFAELLEALEMVRDADNDAEEAFKIPKIARAKIDNAIRKARKIIDV